MAWNSSDSSGCFKSSGNFYFIKKKGICKNNFIKAFGVSKKSYIGKVFSRLYIYYCGGAVNLESEYKKYYKKEFPSFIDYLMERHNLLKEEALKLNNQKSYYKVIENNPERNIDSLIEDSSINKVFISFFGGVIGED